MSLASEGKRVGFTDEQMEFLMLNFSRPGHHHSIGQVDSLADALTAANDGQLDEDELPDDDDDEDDFDDDEEDDDED